MISSTTELFQTLTIQELVLTDDTLSVDWEHLNFATSTPQTLTLILNPAPKAKRERDFDSSSSALGEGAGG